jgi:DNA-binding FadR family transcriptional regulator
MMIFLFQEESRQDTLPRITEQLEALLLFEPIAAGIASIRMTASELKSLEAVLVDLSKAILYNDTSKIVSSHKAFHEIISAATHNRSIVRMLDRMAVTYEMISDVMHRIDQEKRDKVFALHVKLFKAISSREEGTATRESREMIKYITILLHEFEGVDLPEYFKNNPAGNDHPGQNG